MSAKRIVMKKLRELIRLKFECKLSNRQIGATLNISPGSVSYYSRAAEQAQLAYWPLPAELNDEELNKILEPYCRQFAKPQSEIISPDWREVYHELQRKHVTLLLLHEEFCQANPGINYSYFKFCRNFKKWRKCKNITMVMPHQPGEKLFIDYSGDTIPIYSKNSEEVKQAQIFIAVLGFSNYTFAHATFTQTLPDWIDSNIKAIEFFEGVATLTIPDNLKSGISDSCKYDPVANPTYADFASHYDTVILPARPYRPKDKGKVEKAVQIVQHWILARLRKQKFYSLNALNNTIKTLLVSLNNRKFQDKSGTRLSKYIEQEKSHLKPLPREKYELAKFENLTVRNNYHVCIEKHFYSVPHYLVGEVITCRIAANMIEFFHKGTRVASHVKSNEKGNYSTLDIHMPENHLEHKNWRIEHLSTWAEKSGQAIHNLVTEVINAGTHAAVCQRFHLGLKQLAKKYTLKRLNNACLRALAMNTTSYQSLSSILKNRLDEQPYLTTIVVKPTAHHRNIRGSAYYKHSNQEK